MNKNQNLSPKFFDESLEVLDNKFKAKFTEQHKRLKAGVHLCQHLAYKEQSFTLDESQE